MTYYHLADEVDFRLDPDFRPQNNTTMGGDYRPGIFVAGDPYGVSHWCQMYGYWRPWVVEFEGSVRGVEGGYGNEVFIPAEHFDKLRVSRVVPLDAFCRELYQDWGWTESYYETTFDTEEPIAPLPGGWGRLETPGWKGSYRYPGDARSTSSSWRSQYEARIRRYRGDVGGIVSKNRTAGTYTYYHNTSNPTFVPDPGYEPNKMYLDAPEGPGLYVTDNKEDWTRFNSGYAIQTPGFRATFTTDKPLQDYPGVVYSPGGIGQTQYWVPAEVMPELNYQGLHEITSSRTAGTRTAIREAAYSPSQLPNVGPVGDTFWGAGGCMAMSIAFSQIVDGLKIAVEWDNRDGTCNHAWNYDPVSGRSFDYLGTHSDPDGARPYFSNSTLEWDVSPEDLAARSSVNWNPGEPWGDDTVFEALGVIERHWGLYDPDEDDFYASRTAGTRTANSDVIVRGFCYSDVSFELAQKYMSGTVTARDIISDIERNWGSVGVWWGSVGLTENDFYTSPADARGYAAGAGDEYVSDQWEWMEEYQGGASADAWVGAELEVVLVAKKPMRDYGAWDPTTENGEGSVWESTSFFDAGERLELIEVQYSFDGTTWKSEAVGGLTVTAANLPPGLRMENPKPNQVVAYDDDNPDPWLSRFGVGVLSWDDDGVISWVAIQDDAYKRRGIATAMLEYARTIRPDIRHSDELSESGAGWAQAVGSRTAAVDYLLQKLLDECETSETSYHDYAILQAFMKIPEEVLDTHPFAWELKKCQQEARESEYPETDNILVEWLIEINEKGKDHQSRTAANDLRVHLFDSEGREMFLEPDVDGNPWTYHPKVMDAVRYLADVAQEDGFYWHMDHNEFIPSTITDFKVFDGPNDVTHEIKEFPQLRGYYATRTASGTPLYRGLVVPFSEAQFEDVMESYGKPNFPGKVLSYLTQGYFLPAGGLGKHWTTNLNVAKSFAQGGGGVPVVLAVNWDGTGEDPYESPVHNFPGEDEITLLPGTKLEMIDILWSHTFESVGGAGRTITAAEPGGVLPWNPSHRGYTWVTHSDGTLEAVTNDAVNRMFLYDNPWGWDWEVYDSIGLVEGGTFGSALRGGDALRQRANELLAEFDTRAEMRTRGPSRGFQDDYTPAPNTLWSKREAWSNSPWADYDFENPTYAPYGPLTLYRGFSFEANPGVADQLLERLKAGEPVVKVFEDALIESRYSAMQFGDKVGVYWSTDKDYALNLAMVDSFLDDHVGLYIQAHWEGGDHDINFGTSDRKNYWGNESEVRLLPGTEVKGLEVGIHVGGRWHTSSASQSFTADLNKGQPESRKTTSQRYAERLRREGRR